VFTTRYESNLYMEPSLNCICILIVFIVCSVCPLSFCNFVCCVLFECGVLFCVICVILCVVCYFV
jgi:hypothetical protein